MSSHPNMDDYISDYEPRNPGDVGYMLMLAAKDLCDRLEHIALAIEGQTEEMSRLQR